MVQAEVSAFDSKVFWGGLYLTPVVWAVFLFLGVLRLKMEVLPVLYCTMLYSVLIYATLHDALL
jgi:hypothetical protein